MSGVAPALAHAWTTARLVVWTAVAYVAVDWQLRRRRRSFRMPPVPKTGSSTSSTVERTLRRLGATCLRRSLVVQRFHQINGENADLLIGVSKPSSGFRSHAWLDLPADVMQGRGFTVVLRVPPGGELGRDLVRGLI